MPGEGTYTLTSTLGGAHIRGSPMSLTVFRCGPTLQSVPQTASMYAA